MINVNAKEDSVEIGNLEKFVDYTVWVRSVSRRGPGLSSLLIYVRTLEEGNDSHNSPVLYSTIRLFTTIGSNVAI